MAIVRKQPKKAEKTSVTKKNVAKRSLKKSHKTVKPKNKKVGAAAPAKAKSKRQPLGLAPIMQAITDQLNAGVSAEVLIDAIVNATGKKVKSAKTSKAKASAGQLFGKVTRDFGFQLRDKFDVPELKASFKEALARAPKELGLKMSMFNKLYPIADNEMMIISGLKKSKGEWTFTGYTAAGKRATSVVDLPF